MATVVIKIQNLATTPITTLVPQRHCDKGTVWHNNGTVTQAYTLALR
jgi:hypothetical protein